MTDTTADPAKAGKLAQQIVMILINEDSITRQRAIQASMLLLGEVIAQQPPRAQIRSADENLGNDSEPDLVMFFDREGDMKPADNAHLCAAYHYSLFGTASFLTSELKAIAVSAGVVLPDRVDMTLRSARHKGKKLFQPAGTSAFKPTAAACLFFSEKWKIKPGKKTKPTAIKAGADADP